jgi:serine/threonine protein kinase/Flp pilus assembly protein TadD
MRDAEQREEALFEAALQLPAGQRPAYLDQNCVGNADLRRRVEVLLGAFERAGGFMKQPAAPERKMRFSAPPTEKPGDRIGHYKLLEQIGEGGCGVVYVAEQEEPVRRRVALKVIKLGMDTKQVIARFDAERQALAMMDHPSIAKVFDAGTTETGRPYFVMELVRGIRITDYCDQNHVPARERLDLFAQVCRAIQHAHQKGVIHRDIKPSNILVTLHDGVPVPKVIDFGIAKATQGRLTDQTLFTAFEQFIGTPAYMSPEQAEMSGLDIDTRSDIYSLGVLLYELLTGTTPFDAKELLSKGLDELRRTIREVEPVKPSKVVERESELRVERSRVAGAKAYSTLNSQLQSLSTDLDWIVMKCLEKDRARRYETANGLATDIARHLSNEPIVARPPSRLYRIQKAVQRNKLAFGSAAAVALALVIGLGVSTWMFLKEKEARHRAVAAEKDQGLLRQQAQTEAAKAQREAAKSRQVAQFFKDMLHGVGPSVALGRDATILREVLDKTAQQIGQGLTNQPGVEAELRDTLGQVYLALGQYEKAEAMQREALRLFRTLPGDDALDVAGVLNNLGATLVARSQFADAEALYRDSLKLRKKLAGEESAEVADSMMNLAIVLCDEGRFPESETLFRDALARQKKARGEAHSSIASALNGLGLALKAQGKLSEAETTFGDALAMQRKLTGNEHPDLLYPLNNLANLYSDEGKFTQAEASFREALTLNKKFFGEKHPRLAECLCNLGYVLRHRGNLVEAESLLRQAIAMQRELLGNKHSSLAGSLGNLANILRDQYKFAEAESTLHEALDIQRPLLGNDHPDVTGSVMNLATILHAQGKNAEAETAMREALEGFKRSAGTNASRRLPDALNNLGVILVAEGKFADAETAHREALELARQLQPQPHPTLAVSLHNLARDLFEQDKLAEAAAVNLQALETYRRLFNRDDPNVARSLHNLAKVLERQGKFTEAEARYREGLEILRRLLGNHHPDVAQSLHELAKMLLNRGRLPEAESLEREALAIRRERLGNEHADTADSIWNLALILEYQRQWAASEALFLEAIDSRRKFKGDSDLQVGALLDHVATIRLEQGRFAEAESPARECLAIRESQRPDDWRTFDARSLLGGSLLGQKKFAEAESLLLSAYEGMKQREARIPASSKTRLKEALRRISQLYEQAGPADRAAEWKQKLEAANPPPTDPSKR